MLHYVEEYRGSLIARGDYSNLRGRIDKFHSSQETKSIFVGFLCPLGTSGGILKSDYPSICVCVSVTNHVSAITS